MEWQHVSEGPWSRRRKHQSVVWNDQLLLLGGFDGEAAFDLNDVWSWDGQRWQLVTEHAGWSGRDGHCAVVLNGAIYILGGTDDPYNCRCDVWRSEDGGASWRQLCAYAPWPERWQHAACVHEGKIYVAGGWGGKYLNDMWSSSDGKSWTQVCANAPWRPRMFHSAVSFNGAIYIIGGHDGRMQLRDVWASSDGGQSWTQVCQMAQWEGRQGHASVALDGHVYLMGGFGGSSRFNDLWKSKDCAHWTLVSKHCTWSPRQGHASIAYRGSLYIMGGFDEAGYCNNVYKLPIAEFQLSSTSNDSFDGERGVVSIRNNASTAVKITVSLACALECIEMLRRKRSERDLLIQKLFNVLALVMEAVHHTNPANYDHAIQEHAKGSKASKDPHNTQESKDDTSQGANESGKGHKRTNSHSGSLKKGSPLFENIIDISHGKPVLKYGPSITSEEDLRMHFWRTLPLQQQKDGLGAGASSPTSSSSSSTSTTAAASSVSTNVNEASQACGTNVGGESSRMSLTSATLTSAALRDSMEQDRTRLGSLQRSIRHAAEKGDIATVEKYVEERSALSIRASEQAALLLQHVITVKALQEGRQQHLSRMLTQLETLVSLNQSNQSKSTTKNGGKDTTNSNSNSSAADETATQCTWAEWDNIVKSCSESIQIDCSAAEEAMSEFSNDLKEQAHVALAIEQWIGASNDILSSRSFDVLSFALPQPPPSFDAGDAEAAKGPVVSGSSSDGSVPISPTDDQLTLSSSTSVSSNGTTTMEYEALVNQFDAVTERLAKSRMQVKSAADAEIAAITAIEQDTKNLLKTALEKGCGLVKNLISQNLLDIMEINEMEKEVRSWNGTVNCLKNRSDLKAKCDAFVLENAAKEEELLRLEDNRIDIKSLLEKATLKAQRRTNAFVVKDPSGGGAKEQDSSTGSTGLGGEVEELKKQLESAEKAVKDVRREMRSWYREVRKFALEFAPELFQMLPDLQAPGSVLGDGGFASSFTGKSKLPKRRLDEYDDIEPLLSTNPTPNPANVSKSPSLDASAPNAAGSTSNIVNGNGIVANNASYGSGRHVLLKAKYDGEEVVLKGFIMAEGEQRKRLERELSILGRLRNESIICPGAIVEDITGFGEGSTRLQVAVYIEFPYYRGGNLSTWIKSSPRKPWELQGVARQILYGLMYLHDHGIVHKDIKPSNVLLHDDGRVVLADFELSREVKRSPDEEVSTTSMAGTRGFMSPEVESGDHAVVASDMYSFGVLLYFMHFPTEVDNILPGNPRIPPNNDAEMTDLIQKLLVVNPSMRPTAASALMHPYFRSTFVERLMQEGEVVEQDRKLEAVRNLLHNARQENRRNLETISISRSNCAKDVLDYFREAPLEKMRACLRIKFVDEPGIDEGGLLTEMFTIFFDSILTGDQGLFVGCDTSISKKKQVNDTSSTQPTTLSSDSTSGLEGESNVINHGSVDVVLPSAEDQSEIRMKNLRAFGRAMVKALYEGRRIGSRLCPSVFKFITDSPPNMRDLQMFDPQTARSLQWMLATVGVEEFGLHFESVGAPELQEVTDTNKATFVRMKVENILVGSRKPHLMAIKAGFVEALKALSEEAAPFMSLLSHADWRVLLCGESAISGPQVISALKFSNFPKKSQIPTWLKEFILSSSEDHLRKFLVFVTGSPSLQPIVSNSRPDSRVEINVRFQTRSGALPVAHTCFFQLDIPDYRDKETLQNKMIYAIQHANTFEVV